MITPQLGLIRSLRGLTLKFGCFNDEPVRRGPVRAPFVKGPVFALPACWYWIRKLQARFFAGDYASAVDASSMAPAAALDVTILF